MKRIQTLSLILLATVLFAGCKKATFDTEVKGEALGTFRITAPASNTTIALNSATPNAPIVFSWTASKPGVNTQPNYRVVFSLRTGSIDSPIMELASDNAGKATQLTITHKQLDDLLAFRSIPANAPVDLIWSVVANNGTTKQRSDDLFNITLKRMGDGVSPFILYGPLSSTQNLEINPNSTSDTVRFYWQKANPGNVANPVRYKVLFVPEGGNFSTPLFSINSGNSGADTTLKMTWKQISDTLTARGYTNLSQPVKLEWTVVATSGTFSMQAAYVNKLYIARLVRMYLVGAFQGWNINAPMEMIADKAGSRLGNVFYAYLKLNAGDEFKFAKTPGDWNSAFGNTGTSGTGYTTAMNQGGNFQVTSAGVYRLTIDLGAGMAYVQQKQVGLVGSLQSWDPSNPVYGGYARANQFLVLANLTAADEFKFHDGPAWDNSAPDKARWWGKGAAAGTLDNDGNGPNVNNSVGAGRVRAIWDGSNPQQVKYDMTAANEMRVVGDGIQGVNAWDPGTSPQMTYMGNGVWQITLTLIANKDIKFVAGNAWGAFDYEDASGGSQATGTPRAIVWDGSSNFKTPATTGSYTITLNEYNQTVTIN